MLWRGGNENDDDDAEGVRTARRTGDKYDGEVWSVLSKVHPPYSLLIRSHPSCAATVSQSLSSHRHQRKRTQEEVEIVPESEYSVEKVSKEGDKNGAWTSGWCGRKRRGRVLGCRWVDWRGGSGMDEVGWQVSRI